jgi:hypothetical protein
MVWIVVLGADAAVSWRMRWLPVSARVRKVEGESVAARGASREAEVAGPSVAGECLSAVASCGGDDAGGGVDAADAVVCGIG